MRQALFAALLAALLAASCGNDDTGTEPKAAPKARTTTEVAPETEPKVEAKPKAAVKAKPDAATQKVIDQIAKLTANVKSFSADITILPPAGAPAEQAPLKGTLMYVPPHKVKITTARRGKKVIMISDGKMVWLVSPATKTVEIVDIVKVGKAAQKLGQPAREQRFNIAAPLVHMAPGTPKLVGSQKAGGVECWVLEGTPNASIEATKGATVRVFVSKKDGLARRIAYADPAHNIATGTSYDNVKVNVQVDASVFTYTPPEGMNVVDRTELKIIMLEMLVERWKKEK